MRLTARADTVTGVRVVPLALAAAALGVVVALQVALVLARNDGQFFFTLDDPYIHLALAQTILQGGYGVNPGEFSSPSSSILYPLLLVPFEAAGTGVAGALALNLLGLFATLYFWDRLLRLIGWSPVWSASAALGLTLGLNGLGLAFCGMEHTLQVAAALATLVGVAETAERGRLSPLVIPAALLSVLLRFEGLGIAVAAALAIGALGPRRAALGLGAASAGCLGAFALFLTSLGLSPLPSSVLVKSVQVYADLGDHDAARRFQLQTAMRVFLFVAILFVSWAAVFARRFDQGSQTRLLVVGFGTIVVLGHLVCGSSAWWFGRYTAYASAVGLGCLLYAVGHRDATAPAMRARLSWALGLLVLVEFAYYLPATLGIPGATSNVYRQQHQMHRFARDYWQGPVGVNDLGQVAYDNDHYVLDLWGLGSQEARHVRWEAAPGWLDALARGHDVDLAMFYPRWFSGQVPSGWTAVARLVLLERRVSAGGHAVTLYATRPEAVPRIREALVRFAPTLPQGARLDWVVPPG